MTNPTDIFYPWEKIHKDLITLVDRFTAEEFNFRPFASSWSVGEIFFHIAETEEFWIGVVVQKQAEIAINRPVKEKLDVNAIKARLIDSHNKTQLFIASLKESDLELLIDLPDGTGYRLVDILWHVIEHEIHHRGELSLILGLLGREGLDV